MIKSKLYSPVFFILLSLMSCIDPFRVEFEKEDGFLLVEGLITNDRGPYRVSLSRLDTTVAESTPVSGAQVIISDNKGNTIDMVENEMGEYLSDMFSEPMGRIGDTYKLTITTEDGSNYESDPELMQAVPPIDSIYFERFLKTGLSGEGTITEREYLRVKVDFRTLDQSSTLLRFDYRGVFNLVTPDPCMLGCASFCFAPDKSRDFLNIFKQESGGEVPVEEVLIDFEIDKRFSARYILHLRQYALTPSAYEFWEAIENQRINTGSIFDPQPTIIKSNVRNVANEREIVLGYFMASAYSERIGSLTRAQFNELGFEADEFYPECETGFSEPICNNCLSFPGSARDSLTAEW